MYRVNRTSLILFRNITSGAPCHSAEPTKAPVQVFGVEGRYAHALYSAGVKSGKLDACAKDMELVKAQPKLRDFFADPVMQKNDKKDVLEKILKSQGCCDLTVNMMNVMIENGRLKKTRDVCEAFGKIMSAHRGEVLCTVTTAKAMEGSQSSDLESALKSFLKPNQKLILTSKVDPSLIGGMVVELGDKYVDMSIKSKMRLYERIIRETTL